MPNACWTKRKNKSAAFSGRLSKKIETTQEQHQCVTTRSRPFAGDNLGFSGIDSPFLGWTKISRNICKGEKIIKTCLLSVVLFYRETKWISIIFSSHLKHRWNTYLLIWAQKEGKLLMQWNTCSRPCMQSFPRVRESECIVVLAKIENYFDKYLGIYLRLV